MKYLVKTTYTATANHPHETEGTQQVWYTGKGGTVYSNIEAFVHGWCCGGWSRRHFAEKHAQDQIEFHNNSAQRDSWDMKVEVIEI